MEYESLSGLIGERLNRIWEKNKSDIKFKYPPMHPDKVGKKCLLFLSLNPSVSGKITTNRTWASLDSEKSFENNYPKPHPHFKKFFEIQNTINENWTFLDLLYFRDSHQRNIESIYNEEQEKIKEQIELTIEIIQKIKPKLIIVANNFVAKILHEQYMNLFHMVDGIYYLENIPIIIRESVFMGSWWHWNLNTKLKSKLLVEIKRVLDLINEMEKDELKRKLGRTLGENTLESYFVES